MNGYSTVESMQYILCVIALLAMLILWIGLT